MSTVVLGGSLIHLFCGCLFLWGNIAPYVLSYYHHKGSFIPAWTSAMVYPLMTIVLMVMNPLGAHLTTRY